MAQSAAGEARTILAVAQDQHRCVVDAIEAREGARAEALMREHARLASRNLKTVLRNRTRMDLVKGGALIRGAG
jgi:GntR family transcriptional regulator of vanillate catabolism